MEGHNYREPWGVGCKVCGDVNYDLLSWYGRIGKRAKRENITREEAMDRMLQEERA